MSLYDLVSDGNTDFFARRVGGKRQLRREPLSGLVDGANKVYLSTLFPLLASSIKVYLGTVLQTLTTHYTVDADLGTFTFVSAPSVQPSIEAVVVPLTSAQVTLYAWAGFHLMESLWFRNLLLSSNISTYAMATYTDAHIYVVQGPLTTGAAVADPVCGAATFSTSQTQRGLLSRCTELAYLDSMLYEASLSDVDFSERVGGARVGASRRPANIKAARDSAYQEVVNAVYAAMGESDDSMGFLGKGVLPTHSDEYSTIWQWQATGNIGSVAYTPSWSRDT